MVRPTFENIPSPDQNRKLGQSASRVGMCLCGCDPQGSHWSRYLGAPSQHTLSKGIVTGVGGLPRKPPSPKQRELLALVPRCTMGTHPVQNRATITGPGTWVYPHNIPCPEQRDNHWCWCPARGCAAGSSALRSSPLEAAIPDVHHPPHRSHPPSEVQERLLYRVCEQRDMV